MIDGYEYQKQKRREQKERNKKQGNQSIIKKFVDIPNDLFAVTLGGILLLVLIIGLFMAQYHYLEEGRKECEADGMVWKSMSSGKVTTTSCKLP